jgi:hypothetical protein
MPWIVSVSVLSDGDCAKDGAELRQAAARAEKRMLAL